MNIIDIIILIPLLWFGYKGFVNGLAIEIASLLALILGIYLSYHFSVYVGKQMGIEGKYAGILSFVITFIIVVLLVHLLGKIVDKAFNLVSLGFINKFAGVVFGILKVALILSVIIYFIDKLYTYKLIISDKNRNEYKLLKPVKSIAPLIFSGLREENEKNKTINLFE